MTPNKSIAAPEGSARSTAEDWVVLARVVRPRGLKGEVFADVLTDFPERFAERRRLFLRAHATSAPREVALEEHRLHQGRLLLKFKGIDSVEAAEPMRGHEVVIPRAERAPLDDDAVYIGDLSGCVLYDRASAAIIGEIFDVDRVSSNMPLIVVRPVSGGGELLIPFAKAYLPHIDLAEQRMEMTLPEGLLALNDPLSGDERLPLAAAQQNGEAAPDQSSGAPRRPHKKRR